MFIESKSIRKYFGSKKINTKNLVLHFFIALSVALIPVMIYLLNKMFPGRFYCFISCMYCRISVVTEPDSLWGSTSI